MHLRKVGIRSSIIQIVAKYKTVSPRLRIRNHAMFSGGERALAVGRIPELLEQPLLSPSAKEPLPTYKVV